MRREMQTVKRNVAGTLGKVLLAMYLLTGILLVILAAVLYKFELSESAVNIGIIVIYAVSGFAGGFAAGRIQKNKRYLWGAGIGLGYFVILLVVSLVLHRGTDMGILHMVTTLVLCTASGAIGGMLS